jgi:hypothetical protein
MLISLSAVHRACPVIPGGGMAGPGGKLILCPKL